MPLTVRGVVSGAGLGDMKDVEGAVLYRGSGGELNCPLSFDSKQALDNEKGV